MATNGTQCQSSPPLAVYHHQPEARIGIFRLCYLDMALIESHRSRECFSKLFMFGWMNVCVNICDQSWSGYGLLLLLPRRSLIECNLSVISHQFALLL